MSFIEPHAVLFEAVAKAQACLVLQRVISLGQLVSEYARYHEFILTALPVHCNLFHAIILENFPPCNRWSLLYHGHEQQRCCFIHARPGYLINGQIVREYGTY